ncbi:head GIN domain-containing protein [Aureibaculum conchae]|uniref:head GIN domain-containing protein n=1 Tax=Aureibaculum sp. 2308TA14-22 TaxID=3108392 RepID=UPI003393111F
MKTNRSFLILALLSLILTSCTVETIGITVDDEVTTKSISLSDYSEIEISHDFNAYVTFSDTEERIEIEANDKLHQHIIAKKSDNTLIIKLKNNINIKGKETLNVYITTKSITSFSASADSKITLENPLVAEDVSIKLSADSDFSGEVNVEDMDLRGAADTRIDLFGTVKNLDANLSADSKLLNYDLEVTNLKIKMAADCDAYLTVTGTIDVDAVADCDLYYKGNASITRQRLISDSRIIKTD